MESPKTTEYNLMNKIIRFDYQKYREYRKAHDKLSDVDLDNLDSLNHMSSFDGRDVKELIYEGYLILDKWCN